MTNINASFSAAANAVALTRFGAELGRAFNFSIMAFQLGQFAAGAFQPSGPAFSATMPQDGKATVDLGDGYTLEINEANSEFVVKDADGNVTKVWGDPHFDYNGQRVGDFWDTMTLELENGTKITVNTEPYKHNPNETLSSQLVITRGDQAMTINGVSQNEIGDLSITMGGNGYALDAAHSDGLTIRENDNVASGWTSGITGGNVGQADFNLTRKGLDGVPEALQAFSDATRSVLGSWLLFGALSGALAQVAADVDTRATHRLPLFFDRA